MKTPRGKADTLQRDLQSAWNRKLYQWWRQYNDEYVDGVLTLPTIRVGHAQRTLGTWCGRSRTLTISFDHIARDSWVAVMETLRHEMAHQYADEVLRAEHQRPHGSAFHVACEKLRCTAAATASRTAGGASPTAEEREEEDRVRRLRKLLALADSPNEHEARHALRKARHLLVKYNLALVEADRQRAFASRCLGAVKGRHASWELWLGSLLNRFFFVEVLWQSSYDAARDRDGTVLEIYGTAHNLDMAEYVHGYLCRVMEELWKAHRQQAVLTSNRERLHYCAGVVEGFYTAMYQQEARRVATEALVWTGDPRLRAYYRHINPSISMRRTHGVRQTETFDAGRTAGGRVRLRKPLTAAGTGGRCLPP